MKKKCLLDTKKYSDCIKRNDVVSFITINYKQALAFWGRRPSQLARGVFWIAHAHMKETELLKRTKTICWTRLNIKDNILWHNNIYRHPGIHRQIGVIAIIHWNIVRYLYCWRFLVVNAVFWFDNHRHYVYYRRNRIVF